MNSRLCTYKGGIKGVQYCRCNRSHHIARYCTDFADFFQYCVLSARLYCTLLNTAGFNCARILEQSMGAKN
jgi:hypothetical protein